MKIKTIVPTMLFLCILYVFMQAYKVIMPVTLTTVNLTLEKLKVVGVNSKELASIIDFAAKKYNHSPELIIALTQTESNFNEKAVSNMGYNGLMQIPVGVPSDANILIGSRILREKLILAHGDMQKALCLYKGYKIGSKNGIREANKVIVLCRDIKLRI